MTGYADYETAPGVYHRGDIFVSPTYAEGFSNTILEAMASGLPVISTKTVGVVDCLTDDVNGLLVPVQSVDELAAAMLRNDPGRDAATSIGRSGVPRRHGEILLAGRRRADRGRLPAGGWDGTVKRVDRPVCD